MFASSPEGVVISLYIQPNASKTEVVGSHNGSLKIKIKAPPVDGKANEEVVAFLSRTLNVPRSRVEILRGEKSREKKVLVRNVGLEDVRKVFTVST